MSETSRRRRLFGRSLIGASALALPLTASISYAVHAQEELPPVAPAPATPATPEVAPVAPVPAPEADEDDEHNRHVRTIVRRVGPDGKHTVREFSWQGPQPPQFHFEGDWNSEEFQQEMQEFQQEMEEFRRDFADNQDWEKFGEQWAQQGEQWRQWAEQHRAQALALAEQARRAAPQVVVDCDGDNRAARASRTEDGRQVVVICDKRMNRFARSSLRQARNSIANNPEISPEVRNEILEDLDEEIVRIERDTDD